MKQKSFCFSKIPIIFFLLINISFGFDSFDSREIANTALDRVGETGLTCKEFVQSVVTNLGEPLGAGYRDCYLQLGRELSGEDDITEGDIIQISHNTVPGTETSPIHSAIVVENLGNGEYDIVHSNWEGEETVRTKDAWNPTNYLSLYPDWSAHFYRLGNVGYHEDKTKIQAFIDVFNILKPKIGWPNGNGGTDYVHEWKGINDNSFSVICQDYERDDLAQPHYGTDGKSMLILNDLEIPKKAHHLKEGFLGHYRENNGPENYGVPFTKELVSNYANSPNGSNSFIQSGQTITVQKFKRRKNGEYYNNERKTLVYNPSISIANNPRHFALGEFSIDYYDKFPGNRQWYIQGSTTLLDKPWPIAGIKSPTGKWFTDPGTYYFVLHDENGNRIPGSGRLAVITEGNYQFAGDPVEENDDISPPTNLSSSVSGDDIDLVWQDNNPSDYDMSFRVYRALSENGTYGLIATTDNLVYTDNNLSPDTYYYKVMGVSGNEESGYSNIVSAVIENHGNEDAYISQIVTSELVQSSSPWNPIGVKNSFERGDDLGVTGWIEIKNIHRSFNIKYRWYDGSGVMVHEWNYVVESPPAGEYYEWYKIWSWCNFSFGQVAGQWKYRVYIDGVLEAEKMFSVSNDYTFDQALVSGNQVEPVVVKDDFVKGEDDRVHVWIKLVNIFKAINLKVEWYNGQDVKIHEQNNTVHALNEGEYWEWISRWFFLDFSNILDSGQYYFKFYVDNSLVSIKYFDVSVPEKSINYKDNVVLLDADSNSYNEIAYLYQKGMDSVFVSIKDVGSNQILKIFSIGKGVPVSLSKDDFGDTLRLIIAFDDIELDKTVVEVVDVGMNKDSFILYPPENFVFVSSGYTYINLSWQEITEQSNLGNISYNVYASTSNDFASSEMVYQTFGISFFDQGLSPGTRYYYWIKAVLGNGEEESEIVGSIYAETNVLPIPANVVATTISHNRVVIDWGDVSGIEGYQVYRDGSLFSEVNLSSFVDTLVDPLYEYRYKISSCLGEFVSNYSDELVVLIPDIPIDPIMEIVDDVVLLDVDNNGYNEVAYFGRNSVTNYPVINIVDQEGINQIQIPVDSLSPVSIAFQNNYEFLLNFLNEQADTSVLKIYNLNGDCLK